MDYTEYLKKQVIEMEKKLKSLPNGDPRWEVIYRHMIYCRVVISTHKDIKHKDKLELPSQDTHNFLS